MSLISEALKKARQEAVRQDAQRSRSPYAVGVADAAERRTSLVPVLAGLGAGCLVAVLLLTVAWSAGWGPFARHAKPALRVTAATPAQAPVTRPAEPAAVPPATIEEPAPPAAIESASPAPPPVQEARPQPVLEGRPAAPAETPAPRPAPPVPTPAPVEEQRAAAETVAAAPAPSPAPARPSPATPPQGAVDLVDGQTYAGEVPVPGGGMVKLNGIVFSQSQPVAMLDGRVMAPGEIIQGFTLVAVEAGRVKLQGYGATVFVSPK